MSPTIVIISGRNSKKGGRQLTLHWTWNPKRQEEFRLNHFRRGVGGCGDGAASTNRGVRQRGRWAEEVLWRIQSPFIVYFLYFFFIECVIKAPNKLLFDGFTFYLAKPFQWIPIASLRKFYLFQRYFFVGFEKWTIWPAFLTPKMSCQMWICFSDPHRDSKMKVLYKRKLKHSLIISVSLIELFTQSYAILETFLVCGLLSFCKIHFSFLQVK